MKEIEQIYNSLADRYADHAANSPWNAHYERPAMVRQLGADLQGKKVLDIGSASGFYLQYFLDHGAKVTGMDISGALVEKLRDQFGEFCTIYHGDIATDDLFPEGTSFDLVSASLMMHYIEDWSAPLGRIRQLLKPGGRLVFSTHHPLNDLESSPSGIYYRTEFIREYWKGLGTEMICYRRSFSTMYREITAAGFRITDIVEPEPAPGLESINARAYGKLSIQPAFIIFDCEV